MQGGFDHSSLTPSGSAKSRWNSALANAATAVPPLLFGLRLWAAVCLALYVAFQLELDGPYWAGTSAALVCQPHLGASLRKGWFRMIGTAVGAVVIVVLTGLFPQDRTAFLLGLALWGGLCAFVSTVQRNFTSYAAALAGYTAAIIAGDELGAIDGVNGEAFTIAITRVSEIWIGIMCAGIVLAGTDFGEASLRLGRQIAELSSDIVNRLSGMMALADAVPLQMQAAGDLIRRVIALDPLIDEALGESSRLRYHLPSLQKAVEGLFAVVLAWRIAEARLRQLPNQEAQRQADAVQRSIPEELRIGLQNPDPSLWVADPVRPRQLAEASVRRLVATRFATPSLRLLAEQMARALVGLSHVLDGLALIAAHHAHRPHRGSHAKLFIAEWSPALLSAARAFIIIAAVELFWILTEWPNGASAITFAAITVTVLAPKAEASYAAAISFTVGVGLAAVCAAILQFALLPNVDSFFGFAMMTGLFLVPLGALMAQSWHAAMFAPMAGNLVPLLAPVNQMSFNTVQFYNAALAIVAGCGVAALGFRLLPPLSPAMRCKRLLDQSLEDLRRLAIGPIPGPKYDWEGRMCSRLVALKDKAEPQQASKLMVALSVGTEIIRLRRAAPQIGIVTELDLALEMFARGNSAAAIGRFAEVDRRLAGFADGDPMRFCAARARAQILVICDALAQHLEYFNTGATA
jgi:uncharacterized membrane protein YccC